MNSTNVSPRTDLVFTSGRMQIGPFSNEETPISGRDRNKMKRESMGSSELLLLLLLLLAGGSTPASTQTTALPGCSSKCGAVEVPYPFGTSDGCARDDSFLLTCNNTHFDPPKLFLGNINITRISLLEGYMSVLLYIARDCYDSNGTALNSGVSSTDLSGGPLTISADRNRFTATGCDTLARLVDPNESNGFWTGCFSMCKGLESVTNGTCSGVGCCQTSIPKALKYMEVQFKSDNNHTRVWGFNPCSYAFVVDKDAFVFNHTILMADYTYNPVKLPAVLDWSIEGAKDCRTAQKNKTSYACVSQNTQCSVSPNGLGYLCRCSDGYEGNPYIAGGCEDIDECQNKEKYPCNGICTNIPGDYSCICPPGSRVEDPKRQLCVKDPVNQKFPLSLKLAIGLGSSLLFLTTIASLAYWTFQKQKLIRLKQQFFTQNGGLFLQEQISAYDSSAFKIFSMAELEKATNNFDKSTVIGKGGHGTVYKGTLKDSRTVAIKRSMVVDENKSKEFAKELFILSQINHKNVVKILGCCMETEVPILVYEYIPNGTLFHYLHIKKSENPISFMIRLRIAKEVAEALAYLHSAASPPILHGDVKPSNILLDEIYTAKVSDFGTSTLAPNDKSQFTTIVQGTCGYLDPEYLQTCELTEKSDVYSFGIVLVELFTRKKALQFGGSEGEKNTAISFIRYVNENRVEEILDPEIVKEGLSEPLQHIAELALSCLSMKGEERPTMRDVLMDLERILRSCKNHPWAETKAEERESLLCESSVIKKFDVPTYTTMEIQALKNMEDGR